MLDFMTFLILSLATWRLSSLLTQEDGPWRAFEKMRQQVQKITTVLECVWCVSIWIAIVLMILTFFYPITLIFLAPFAISTMAILVDRYSQ